MELNIMRPITYKPESMVF